VEFDSEFWAAISGAILGGLIATGMQLLTLVMTAKQRAQTELTLRQGLARSLLFKVVKVFSDFKVLNNHAIECNQRAIEHKDAFSWKWFSPLANLPRPVIFTAEEMGTLLACKDNDLFNEVAALDDIHNGLIQSLELYRARRAALSDELPARMQGMVGTIEIDEATCHRIGPRVAELEQLTQELAYSFRQNADPSFSVAARLTAAFDRTYKLGISITPIAPPGSPTPPNND